MKKRKTFLQTMLSPIATTLMGFVGGGYNATDPRRKLLGQGTLGANRAGANTLLASSGPVLRGHCRNLERNNPSARAGIEALVGLVVGTGIALEPDTGDDAKNKQIRDVFNRWCRQCGVAGDDIYHLQQIGMREVVTVGEALWRLVPDRNPVAGEIPLKVLPLESEWLSETEAMAPVNGCTLAPGVALDAYGQAVTYFISPPEFGKPEKVPATNIVHIFERRRPLQARGEPWLAPVIETLMNERDLVDAELYAAKQTAAIAMVITSEAHGDPDTTEDGTTDDPAQAVRLGGVARLYPGEDMKAFGHTRPSQQIAPFRQMLRGDLAAALRIPQRYLDRDVSRANYSSMRADMLDTDRLLSPVREWYGHQSIGRIYTEVAPIISAIVGFKFDPKAYRLLPDAQPYVDPVKDVDGAVRAITAGLSNFEAEISKRGGDYRSVWKQIAKEQAEATKLGIKIDLSGTNAPAPDSTIGVVTEADKKGPAAQPAKEMEDDGEETKTEDEDVTKSEARAILAQVESTNAMNRQLMDELRHSRAAPPVQQHPGHVIHTDMRAEAIREVLACMKPPQIDVHVPAQAAPQITVQASEVRMEPATIPAPQVVVNVPQQAAPQITVEASPVTVQNTVEVPSRTIKATPQRDGSVLMVPQ
jgi:lambda family phage portal protein